MTLLLDIKSQDNDFAKNKQCRFQAMDCASFGGVGKTNYHCATGHRPRSADIKSKRCPDGAPLVNDQVLSDYSAEAAGAVEAIAT